MEFNLFPLYLFLNESLNFYKMITTKKIFSALVALTISVAMVSCSGDDGEQGPKGATGADGNANVNTSMFSVLEGDFGISIAQAGNNFRISHRDTLDVSGISNDVMTSGTVQVFYDSEVFTTDTNATTWTAMPHFNSRANVAFNSTIAEQEVRIDITYVTQPDNQGNPQVLLIGDYDFKVVVIPSSAMIDGVDPTDYKALEAVYGLE